MTAQELRALVLTACERLAPMADTITAELAIHCTPAELLAAFPEAIRATHVYAATATTSASAIDSSCVTIANVTARAGVLVERPGTADELAQLEQRGRAHGATVTVTTEVAP